MAYRSKARTRIPSGEKWHRVAFQRVAIVVDGFGNETETWPEYASDWAAVSEVPVVRSELDAVVFQIVELLFRDGIKVQDRVIIDGETEKPLKIIAIVDPSHFHQTLQLHCIDVSRTPIGFGA